MGAECCLNLEKTEECPMANSRSLRAAPLAGNTATGALKLIALCFMMIDHMGKMLFPQVPEMRILGRIAFPLYAWCMVVGFHYTRNPWRYALRILVVGVVSQPLYMLALNHTWREPNIFLTLFFALLGLMAVEEKPWERDGLSQRILGRLGAAAGLVLCLCAAVWFGCDYGWRGVLLVTLLYAARGSRSALAAVMVAFCLYWGTNSSTVASFFGLSLRFSGAAGTLLSPWLRLQALAILALPLMLIPWKRDLRLPAWVGYGIYPAHLAVLWLLEQLL